MNQNKKQANYCLHMIRKFNLENQCERAAYTTGHSKTWWGLHTNVISHFACIKPNAKNKEFF